MSKKLIVVAIMAVMFFGVSISQATPSRLETLGQGTGLVYVLDDTNIFTDPAALSAYRNVALLHMGGLGGDMNALGGVSLGIGEMLTFAIIAARNPSFQEGLIGEVLGVDRAINDTVAPWAFNNNWGSYAGAYPVALGAVNVEAMNWLNPIDVILAAKFGNISVGASYYIANGKRTGEATSDTPPLGTDTSYEEKAFLHAVKFGVAADMGQFAPEVWFHYVPFKVNSLWEQNIAPTTSFERQLKGREFDLGTRIFVKVNDNLTIVPSVEWRNVSGDVTIDSDPNMAPVAAFPLLTEEELAETYKGNGINAGIGINWQNDKVLFASSIGMQYQKMTQEFEVDGLAGSTLFTEKWLALPVLGMGIEYQATKIVTFRGGLSTTTIYGKRTNSSESDEYLTYNPENTTTVSEQDTTAAVGLGLTFGNLIIDVSAGNLLVAGEPATFSLFSALDAKYKF